MKTIFTLLVSFGLASSVFAADIRSTATLTVKSANRSDIVVMVDDTRYDLGTYSIMISDLEPCDHDIVVYQENEDKSVSSLDKIYDEVFHSTVGLKAHTNLMISIDECGIITMNEIKEKLQRIGDDWKGEAVYNNESVTKSYSNAIDKNGFDRVLWAISKESSETNRMESAGQIIKTSYFTTEQVKQLMKLFCTEENKLAIAKLAYDKTIDRSNYYAINDAFKLNTSKDELARCIGNGK